MRPSIPRLTAALAAALATMAAPSIALAGPLRVTFLDCGAISDCSGPTSVMSRFDTPGTIVPPAVPGPRTITPPVPVPVLQQLDGSFAGLGIRSFNNNGVIGSDFIFEDLIGAGGFAYPELTLVSPFDVSALRLSWGIGQYTGLGRVTCLALDCSRTTTIRSYVRLDIADAPTTTVPEPTTPALVALALGAGWFARRRHAG